MKKAYTRRGRDDIKLAEELGWTFHRLTGSGHLQFTHPLTGVKMTIPATPSCSRSVKNSIAWIRKNTPREE